MKAVSEGKGGKTNQQSTSDKFLKKLSLTNCGGQGSMPRGQGSMPGGQGSTPRGQGMPKGQGMPRGQGTPGGQGTPRGQGSMPRLDARRPRLMPGGTGGQGSTPGGKGSMLEAKS